MKRKKKIRKWRRIPKPKKSKAKGKRKPSPKAKPKTRKGIGGPKPRVFTPEDYAEIEKWRVSGMTHLQIAEKLGLSESHLYAKKKEIPELAEALKKAKPICTGIAVGKLWGIMMNDMHPKQVTALIFWLKTQAGWKETHEIKTPDGQPIELKEITRPKTLDDKQVDEILGILHAARKSANPS